MTFKMNYFIPFTDTTTNDFNINFPLDLDVKIKSVLLGACFLLVSSITKIRLDISIYKFINIINIYVSGFVL